MKLTKLHKEAIVRAIMQDTPAVDKTKRRADIIKAVLKLMSPECRKVYSKTPTAISTYYSGDVAYDNVYSHREIPRGDAPEDKIKEILQPYIDEDDARNAMRRKLTHAFEGINTLKQALTTFPEFKKYYPTEMEPTKNLPALANVMADLTKLGWPKQGATK